MNGFHVIVTNLPFDFSPKTLYTIFERYGKIMAVYPAYGSSGRSLGFGIVEFKHIELCMADNIVIEERPIVCKRHNLDLVKELPSQTVAKNFIFDEMKKNPVLNTKSSIFEFEDRAYAIKSLFGSKPTGLENVFDLYKEAGEEIPEKIIEALEKFGAKFLKSCKRKFLKN